MRRGALFAVVMLALLGCRQSPAVQTTPLIQQVVVTATPAAVPTAAVDAIQAIPVATPALNAVQIIVTTDAGAFEVSVVGDGKVTITDNSIETDGVAVQNQIIRVYTPTPLPAIQVLDIRDLANTPTPQAETQRGIYFEDDWRLRCERSVPFTHSVSAEIHNRGGRLCTQIDGAATDPTAAITNAEIAQLAQRHNCPDLTPWLSGGIAELVQRESAGLRYTLNDGAQGILQIHYRWFYIYWRDTNQAVSADPLNYDAQFEIGCWLLRSDLNSAGRPLQWAAIAPPSQPTTTTTPTKTQAEITPISTKTQVPPQATPDPTFTPTPTATTDCPQPDATMPGNQQQILIHPCQVEQVTGCTVVERGAAPSFGWRCLEWGGIAVSLTPMTRSDVLAWVPVDPDSAEAQQFADQMTAIMQCSTGGHRGWISGTAHEYGAIPVHQSNYQPDEYPFTSDAINVTAAWHQYQAGEFWRWPWGCAGE